METYDNPRKDRKEIIDTLAIPNLSGNYVNKRECHIIPD